MDPKIWGPTFWKVLFQCCKIADEQQKSNKNNNVCLMPELIESLRFSLPCSECRTSFAFIVECLPPQSPYLKWIWKVRNIVNQKLQCESSKCLSFDNFMKKSKKRFATNSDYRKLLKLICSHYNRFDCHVPKEHIRGVERFMCTLACFLKHDFEKDKNLKQLLSVERCKNNMEESGALLKWVSKIYCQT